MIPRIRRLSAAAASSDSTRVIGTNSTRVDDGVPHRVAEDRVVQRAAGSCRARPTCAGVCRSLCWKESTNAQTTGHQAEQPDQQHARGDHRPAGDGVAAAAPGPCSSDGRPVREPSHAGAAAGWWPADEPGSRAGQRCVDLVARRRSGPRSGSAWPSSTDCTIWSRRPWTPRQYDAMLGRTCLTLSRLATKTFSAGNFFRNVW